MPSAIPRAVRLVRLIQMFESGGSYRAADLGEVFGCSQRMIERNLRDLRRRFGMRIERQDTWEWSLVSPADDVGL